MRHEVKCGCGWSYSTDDRTYGSLYCRRAYEQHLQLAHPLRETSADESYDDERTHIGPWT